MFISSGPSGQSNELMDELNPDNEIRNLVMDQATEHLYEHRKFVWDEDKKTFKKKKFNAEGEMVNEDHKQISKDKMRVEKMQDRYKQWKKHSIMNFQKVGDKEVVSNTSKAVASFKNRMTKKQLSDSIKRRKELSNKGVYHRSRSEGAGDSSGGKFKKEGFFKGRKVTSELKNSKQIAKEKAKKRGGTFGKGGNSKSGFKNKSGDRGRSSSKGQGGRTSSKGRGGRH